MKTMDDFADSDELSAVRKSRYDMFERAINGLYKSYKSGNKIEKRRVAQLVNYTIGRYSSDPEDQADLKDVWESLLEGRE